MAIQQEDSEGGVGTRDQDRDIGMVDPAPDCLVSDAPAHPVVKGAAGEEDDGGQGEDSQRDPALEAVGDRDQGEACDQAQGRHDQMDDSAQFRRQSPHFGPVRGLQELVHVSTIAQMGEKSDPDSRNLPSACRWKAGRGEEYWGNGTPFLLSERS